MKTKLTKVNKAPKVKKGETAPPKIIARADDAYGSKNYAEFSVEKKKEGMYLASRVLMIIFYVIATLAYILFCSAVKFFLWFLVILPVFVMLIVYMTWWRVSIDYKYTVDHSLFTVKTVYGDRYEALLFEEKIRDISLVAPYDGEYKKEADSFAEDAERIYAVSSKDARDIYFVCHTNESKKTIVFFEMTSQALGAFTYYNSATTVVSELER